MKNTEQKNESHILRYLKMNLSHITQTYFQQIFSPKASTFELAMTDDHLHHLKLKYQEAYCACNGDKSCFESNQHLFVSHRSHRLQRFSRDLFISENMQGRQGSRTHEKTNTDGRTCMWLFGWEFWMKMLWMRQRTLGLYYPWKHEQSALWLMALSPRWKI